MTDVVIFGATGYVGRPLTDELINRGHTVTAVARNVAGLPAPPRLRGDRRLGAGAGRRAAGTGRPDAARAGRRGQGRGEARGGRRLRQPADRGERAAGNGPHPL